MENRSSLFHCDSGEKCPIHNHCLQGKSNWRKYLAWKGSTEFEHGARLALVFIKEVKPVFHRLNQDDLDKCLQGKT